MNRQEKRSALREKQKLAKKHDAVLIELLHKFYNFLDKSPKPSDEEVRTEFRKSEKTWQLYCLCNNLGMKAFMLFNARVSYEWERKYVLPKNKE